MELVARPNGPGKIAVACDCSSGERATRVIDRARVPKRYEHCDFGATSRIWPTEKYGPRSTRPIAEAGPIWWRKASFANIRAPAKKGLLLMGPSG